MVCPVGFSAVPRGTKRALLFTLFVAVAMPASAQSNPQADRITYNYAVKCFAAMPFARKRGLSHGDGDQAFRVAYVVGTRLGFTPDEVGNDVKARTKTEMTKMNGDAAYLQKVLNDCSRLGLL